MPNVYDQFTRKNQTVKNLGWLLKNASNADIIRIYPQLHGTKLDLGAFMRVEMAGALNGKSYCVKFESFAICKQWVLRRALRHCYIEINHPDKPLEVLQARS